MRHNWLEWVALVTSLVVILAVAGFLVVDGITGAGRPPRPSVELLRGEAYETPAGWILPARVVNGGDEAAEALTLVATVAVDGEEEDSEVIVDYLPVGSAVEVSFAFSAEPDGEVTVRTIGFRLP